MKLMASAGCLKKNVFSFLEDGRLSNRYNLYSHRWKMCLDP
jgi:hypothetical protein